MNFNPAMIVPELFQLLLILVLMAQSLCKGKSGIGAQIWTPIAAAFGIDRAARNSEYSERRRERCRFVHRR